jgi:hypothetical protein
MDACVSRGCYLRDTVQNARRADFRAEYDRNANTIARGICGLGEIFGEIFRSVLIDEIRKYPDRLSSTGENPEIFGSPLVNKCKSASRYSFAIAIRRSGKVLAGSPGLHSCNEAAPKYLSHFSGQGQRKGPFLQLPLPLDKKITNQIRSLNRFANRFRPKNIRRSLLTSLRKRAGIASLIDTTR